MASLGQISRQCKRNSIEQAGDAAIPMSFTTAGLTASGLVARMNRTGQQMPRTPTDGLAEGDGVGPQIPALREEAARRASRVLSMAPKTTHDFVADHGETPPLRLRDVGS